MVTNRIGEDCSGSGTTPQGHLGVCTTQVLATKPCVPSFHRSWGIQQMDVGTNDSTLLPGLRENLPVGAHVPIPMVARLHIQSFMVVAKICLDLLFGSHII